MKIENVILVLAIIISFVVLGVTLFNMNKIEEIGNENQIVKEEVIADATDRDEMVKKLLDVYLKEYGHFEDNEMGTFPEILQKLNLETEENIDKLLDENFNKHENFKTNVKYEDFKAAMLTMVSEKYFNENYSNYTNIDGFVSVNDVASEYMLVELADIEFVKYDESIDCYIYNVKVKDPILYHHYEAGETSASFEDCFFDWMVNIKETKDGVVIDEKTFIPKDEKEENVKVEDENSNNNENKIENEDIKTEDIKNEEENQTDTVPQPELDNTSNSECEVEVEYIEGNEVAGHIKIPKFNVDAPIFRYVNMYTMNLSAGVTIGNLNEVGHTVLMGHAYSGYPFEKISELENGDTVIVTDAQKREVTYEVFDKQVVSSNDASYMMRDTAGKREITMQTGHSDTTRLIVLIREKN